MNRSMFTLIIATIFTVAGITFAMKHEWLIAALFILIGVIYVIKGIHRGHSNK
ncbi:hypothetical protein [Staphylococcus ursi]|uniref:hypothetical protein n=1 Tax=Staphylococcus sp. MI 10-1553 TaxID=1912064 RepID=UPI00193A6FF3|nr:hypothetical protein [Staphylococcus sp. MI 10-1553]